MKKTVLAIAAIMIVLALLLPFISRTPDGVQSLTKTSGKQQQPVWNGLMANYSVGATDPYISTLIAGLIGTAIVLIAGSAMGTALAPKKKNHRSIAAAKTRRHD